MYLTLLNVFAKFKTALDVDITLSGNRQFRLIDC